MAPIVKTVDELRALVRDAGPDLQLIDVRQPGEFRDGHIPGAQLIPVSRLPGELAALNPDKPTVVYCRGRIRAAAAARYLRNAGFSQAAYLDGGMAAWDGLQVDGLPDAGMTWFDTARSISDLIVIAWSFEEGARIFYQQAADQLDGEARALFELLSDDEVHHKASLRALHHRLAGEDTGVFDGAPTPAMMEGGMALPHALAWIRGKSAVSILEVAIALETTAYDRYAQLTRLVQDDRIIDVFAVLAEGERIHIEKIGEMLDALTTG